LHPTTQRQTKTTNSTLRAHLNLLFATVIWASTFINIKFTLTQVPANTLAFLRFFIASIALLLFNCIFPQPFIKKQDLRWVALSGLTGVTLYNFFQNQGLRYAGATDAAIFSSLTPIFMAIMGYLFYQEKITPLKIMGIILAFSGTIIVATGGSWQPGSLNYSRLWGDFLVSLIGLCWAFYNITLKKLLPKYPVGTILTYTSVSGTLFLFPLIFFETPNLSKINLSGWLNILYLGIFASALAYFFWNKALHTVTVSTAGVYLYLIPIITILIALIFLHEIPTIYTILGGFLTLSGIYFAGK